MTLRKPIPVKATMEIITDSITANAIVNTITAMFRHSSFKGNIQPIPLPNEALDIIDLQD